MCDSFEIEESEEVEAFNEAANHMTTIVGDLDQVQLLNFYGLYKQATAGDCNTPKPGIFALQAKAKWNAWNDRKNMTTEQAMSIYVETLSSIKPDWRLVKTAKEPPKQHWVAVSRLKILDVDAALDDIPEDEKTCFDYVKEGNAEKLEKLLNADSARKTNLNALDNNGMGLIHWAADRGHSNILDTLLKHGIDVNAVDEQRQTALHYASSCGHGDCVKILVEFGADRTIRDEDGLTCVDVADADICELLN